MTSLTHRKRTSVQAEDSTDAYSTDYEAAKQRHATVYDAVAGMVSLFTSPLLCLCLAASSLHLRSGRVSLKLSKDSAAGSSGSRKTSSGHHQLADPILAPEEVLFSRKHAPQRYAEKDIYFAHENLPGSGHDVLPDSDMLKAVHGYTSHFYEALAQRHDREGRGNLRLVDERSMDETALLALGMLLEEAARESLGKNGDLVFTEGVEDATGRNAGKRAGREDAASRGSQTRAELGGDDAFWKRKHPKRRKIRDDGD